MPSIPAVDPIDLLIPLLAEPPDLSALEDKRSWDLIKEHSARYGVAPLVAHAARKHVSSQERLWCDRILIDSWTRHQRMLKHLEDLLGLLETDGIPVIALKGPLLAQRYYKPAFLRKPSGDIDLAVVEHDLKAACNTLLKVGYRLSRSFAEEAERSHHIELFHPSLPKVELHLRLSHMARGIPVNEFFERTISLRLPNGRDARVLGSADQLLHLLLHFAHSRFGTLFHFYEIRRVCGMESLSARVEAIGRAVDHHYAGVLRMVDIAFRSRWGERFIPASAGVPATWLDWRINEKLYKAYELWSAPERKWTLATRFWGRWLDFQITDTPSDFIRSVKLLVQAARFRNARHDWVTKKNLYGAGPGEPRR